MLELAGIRFTLAYGPESLPSNSPRPKWWRIGGSLMITRTIFTGFPGLLTGVLAGGSLFASFGWKIIFGLIIIPFVPFPFNVPVMLLI
jgi:hypothetical protein